MVLSSDLYATKEPRQRISLYDPRTIGNKTYSEGRLRVLPKPSQNYRIADTLHIYTLREHIGMPDNVDLLVVVDEKHRDPDSDGIRNRAIGKEAGIFILIIGFPFSSEVYPRP